MRDIKFKIYDKELKESHIEELEDLCEDDYWYDGETEVWSVLKDCNDKQERFVALQYTGIEDKNNYEIYEGDIVKANFFDKEITGKIEFAFGAFFITDSAVSDNQLFIFHDLEVIGNIWDNPELLEKVGE